MIDGIGQFGELVTANDLLTLQTPGKSTELARGRLIVREPPSTYHGRVQGILHVLVGSYVRAHTLGAVFGQDTGFKIASDPDTVRAPDLAFVARARGRAKSRGAGTRLSHPISWRRFSHRRTDRVKCLRRRGSGSRPA